jgi:hypothetical protein
MRIDGSPLLLFGFMMLTMGVVAAWFLGVWVAAGGLPEHRRAALLVRTGVATIGWMVLVLFVAASGVLLHFDWRPPPMLGLLLISLGLALAIGLSSFGGMLARGLPLSALVGFHLFRWPLELLLHRGYVENLVPVQMTYAGRNVDIATGILAAALAVAMVQVHVPRFLVLVWNVLGLALLVNVLAIAVLSMPMIRYFGPGQMVVWVALPPYVWLPAVLVVAALAGHIVIFRRLMLRPEA